MRFPRVRIFSGNHGLNGPKTVTKGVQLDGVHSLHCLRAGRSEGILVVRFELLFADHALHPPQ